LTIDNFADKILKLYRIKEVFMLDIKNYSNPTTTTPTPVGDFARLE
jgi:hypothetical protein